MSYDPNEITPEWEPAAWPISQSMADVQKAGFDQRSMISIDWSSIDFKNFPKDGVFGETKDWLMSVDAAFYANSSDEKLLLIDNTYFGWPDPPRWGLLSRLAGEAGSKWVHWGHFPDLPATWTIPNA